MILNFTQHCELGDEVHKGSWAKQDWWNGEREQQIYTHTVQVGWEFKVEVELPYILLLSMPVKVKGDKVLIAKTEWEMVL